MIASDKCINLIKQFEGLYFRAYLDPAGIPTIGYGSIRWPDGDYVKMGQEITIQQADQFLRHEVNYLSNHLTKKLKQANVNVNQNQFDALISFAYNLGLGSLLGSTLYHILCKNVNDNKITNEFMRWTKARVKGQLVELKGLVRRRKAEAELYNEKI